MEKNDQDHRRTCLLRIQKLAPANSSRNHIRTTDLRHPLPPSTIQIS